MMLPPNFRVSGLTEYEGEGRPQTSKDDILGDSEACKLPDGWIEERIKVDRRTLEVMIQASQYDDSHYNAALFFDRVMQNTSTNISWPSKLKIGAKSKKDPHIKITGMPEKVQQAKEQIMSVLDSKSTRVTLKMDVSHTEHSHIIGKGGLVIKKVMQKTSCHIHFPDSNRNGQLEKSNQVSIAGQPEDVEVSRVSIRELLPLTFMFELPSNLPTIQLDLNCTTGCPSAIQRIQQAYNVSVSLRQRSNISSATNSSLPVVVVMIRGSIPEADKCREATISLMKHFTNNQSVTLPVSLQLEIATQHHLFLIGKGGANLKAITRQSGAAVHFPDPMNQVHRRSTVYITGSIDCVLYARTLLIGCLPLVLMFDLREDQKEMDQVDLNILMDRLDVFISIKPKPKQTTKSVIIKCIERNASCLYVARKKLLGEQGVNDEEVITRLLTTQKAFQVASGVLINRARTPYDLLGNNSMLKPPFISNRNNFNQINHSNNTNNCFMNPPSSSSSMYNGLVMPPPTPSPAFPVTNFNSMNTFTNNEDLTDSNFNSILNRGIRNNDSSSIKISHLSSPTLNKQISLNSMSKDKYKQHSLYIDEGVHGLGYSDDISPSSDTSSSSEDRNVLIASSLFDENDNSFDYEQKKQMASKAMLSQPNGESSRTPTDAWSGLGFSRSMPGHALRERLRQAAKYKGPSMDTTYETTVEVDLDPWKDPLKDLSASSYSFNTSADSFGATSVVPQAFSNSCRKFGDYDQFREQSVTVQQPIGRPLSNSKNNLDRNSVSSNTTDPKDLTELFASLGLGKYTSLFKQQEIDLQTFLSLSDTDLKELGITTFGARRKMLLSITDITKNMGVPSSSGLNNKNISFRDNNRTLNASHSGRW